MNKISSIILSALFLVSCSQIDDEIVRHNSQEVSFVFSLPTVATRANSTSFEVGDKVGLFATSYPEGIPAPLQVSGNWSNNNCLTYDGLNWNPYNKILWCEEKMDFYAYYPYIPNITSIDGQLFSVAIDQSVEAVNGLSAYEASDFLWASAKGVSKDSDSPSPVSLQFKHSCAKIIVKLVKGEDFEGSFPEDGELLLHSLYPQGVINFENGTVTKYNFGSSQTIKCRPVQNPSDPSCPEYEAVIIPQKVDSRRPFIEYCAGNASYLSEDVFSFKPGMCYTYVMTISTSPQSIVINIGGSIDGWN